MMYNNASRPPTILVGQISVFSCSFFPPWLFPFVAFSICFSERMYYFLGCMDTEMPISARHGTTHRYIIKFWKKFKQNSINLTSHIISDMMTQLYNTSVRISLFISMLILQCWWFYETMLSSWSFLMRRVVFMLNHKLH